MAGGTPSRYNHLPANERELAVINPHLVGAIEGDGIATPDKLGIEFL